MKQNKKHEAIKEAVRAHYSKVAEGSQDHSDCCGSTSPCCDGTSTCCTEGSGVAIYEGEELSHLPNEAVTSSCGCGNPVALASLQPGEVVLDLGSGGGLDVLLAAGRVGPEGFVYGLDMTDEMLELARRNAERAGVQNVAFLKGDIEAIPMPDSSVDVIISNCVINLTPDKGQALREAFRVLKPGGRLAVSDIVIEPDLQGLPVSEDQIRAVLSWVGCIAGALTAEEYRRLLAEAGFEGIEVEVQHRYSLQDVLSLVPEAVKNLPIRVAEDLVSRFTSSAIRAKRPV